MNSFVGLLFSLIILTRITECVTVINYSVKGVSNQELASSSIPF